MAACCPVFFILFCRIMIMIGCYGYDGRQSYDVGNLWMCCVNFSLLSPIGRLVYILQILIFEIQLVILSAFSNHFRY